jgi:outer membrane receptor protein involved in Fe transport
VTPRPYAYRSSLEAKTTANGGYGYGFTGPNPSLRPEFAKSYEFGTEMSFLDDRAGIDVTVYRKTTTDQIVNDVRASYAPATSSSTSTAHPRATRGWNSRSAPRR